ncbi:MAG: hypothetical protein WC197_06825 [Candidatus Gastranaerophilaceae bacterium]|jgi:hypothetical protein
MSVEGINNVAGSNLLTPLSVDDLQRAPKYSEKVNTNIPADSFENKTKEKNKHGFAKKAVTTIVALCVAAAAIVVAKKSGFLERILKKDYPGFDALCGNITGRFEQGYNVALEFIKTNYPKFEDLKGNVTGKFVEVYHAALDLLPK